MKAIIWIDYKMTPPMVLLGCKSDDDQSREARCFQHDDPKVYELLGQDAFEGDVQDDELADFLLSKGFVEKSLAPQQWRRVVSQMVFAAAEIMVKGG